MRQIRMMLFETNSSSTHTLTICTEEEYEKYKNGEYGIIDPFLAGEKYREKKFFTWEEARQYEIDYFESRGEKYGVDYDDEWIEQEIGFDFTFYGKENENHELFERHFVTPSGDEMVAFGEYGWD